MPIAGLTSDSEPKHTHTGNQMPRDGLIPDNTQQEDTECQSLVLHPFPNTHKDKTKKGRPERSAHLLPTYLIWYEDQGDVVPLRRDTRLA